MLNNFFGGLLMSLKSLLQEKCNCLLETTLISGRDCLTKFDQCLQGEV